MPLDVGSDLREVHLGERRVVRAAARDHQLVDRLRQVVEEALEAIGLRGVERRGAHRADLARGAREAFGAAAGEDDLGPLGTGAPRGFEADAGAAADDDDGLAEQLGLAPHGRDGAHGASGDVEPTPACSRADAISAVSALSASM